MTMQNLSDIDKNGGVPIPRKESETSRQRTQQETNLLSLINPTLAATLATEQMHNVQSIHEWLPAERDIPDEQGDEEVDDDDVDIATDSEAGELDIPKPLPKALTAAQKKKQQRKERVMSQDRGPVIHKISPSDVQPHAPTNPNSKVTWDEDPEIVCSYNWSSVADGSNTIFVPGGPSKWTPQAIPYTVPGDKGFHPTDYNYVRQPRDPFSPVFNAMTIMNPDYAFNSIDILADRNNLRVLLEFVQGKTVGPFRLDLYMVFNTLIIVRREDGFWRRSNGTGYGFNFEKHFTTPTPDMTDATSHYRAVRYRMGPLNVICRFEADAYVDTEPDTLSESDAAAVITPVPNDQDLMQRPKFTYFAPFKVLQKGSLIPGHQILELKTQVEKHLENQSFGPWQDQLWFGRTKHIFTGRYQAGTGKILYIKKEDATERVKRWEEKNQTDLQKLVALLLLLRGTLMKQKGSLRSAILVREDPRGQATLHEMLNKKNVVQRQFFERHWMNHVKPRSNTRQEARGGADPQGTRGSFAAHAGKGRGQSDGQREGVGRQGVHRSGRGRGQSDEQRGGDAQKLPTRAQEGQAQQPEIPIPKHLSRGQVGSSTQPSSRDKRRRGVPRGVAGHRDRGQAARRGRGNTGPSES
ncbi:hypothetical protein SVAN01_01122 [Stagonosporopsis vannaccii]|nr:hypothetical protein SVAN01_01122 [Stagonosporopsis vannaccii]